MVKIVPGDEKMTMNIRDHIINNFKGDNYEELERAIEESIKEQDEVTLPGMGVFFELIWQGADRPLKDQMLEVIKKRIAESTKGTSTS